MTCAHSLTEQCAWCTFIQHGTEHEGKLLFEVRENEVRPVLLEGSHGCCTSGCDARAFDVYKLKRTYGRVQTPLIEQVNS